MKMDQTIGSAVPEAIPAKSTNLPDNLSPQCIGREFVRCYYTLLHDNPNKLHRFYLDQSTFVHGNQTDETAECVSGQRAIHEKIMSLNFEDCRTKIKHVDSQPTIDHGVVVQVSGELSNAGKLPRRFMQTFVLGSQTPRKYYVHNDIFRYQDEVFGYDQEDAADDEDNSLSSQEDINDHVEEEPAAPVEEVYKHEIEQQFEEQPNGNIEEPEVLNNNHEMPAEDIVVTHDYLDHINAIPDEPEVVAEEPEEVPAEVVVEPEYEPVVEEVPEPVEVVEPEPEIPEEIVEPVPEVPKGPKSWAMIAGSGSNPAPIRAVVSTPAPKAATPAPPAEPKEAFVIKKETAFTPFQKDADQKSEGGRAPRRGPKPDNRESKERGFGGERSGNREKFQEREAPNAHQIFVGNLPHNTPHAELEEKFKSFGTVLHVRVTPNNFGFVVFENEGPVQAILSAVKTGEKFFLADQRLNVEEKKTVMNSNRGPRKPFSHDQRGGGSRRGGSRRGAPVGRSSYNDHNSDSK